jgi:hypothetical protein
MAEAEVRRSRGPKFGVGSVLARSFPIWGRNIVPFTFLSLIFYLPLLIYAFVTFRGGEVTKAVEQKYNLVVFFGGGALNLIITGAVVYGVFQQIRGQHAGLGQCLRVGLARLFPVLGVGIVVGFLYIIGFVCLVIPGILVQLVYWVAVPVAVVERLGVGASMSRSSKLTSGERGTIFLLMLVVGAIYIGFILGMGVLLSKAGVIQVREPLTQALAGLLAPVIFGALMAVINAVGYHDLRVAKEGVGIEDLVRVFE